MHMSGEDTRGVLPIELDELNRDVYGDWISLRERNAGDSEEHDDTTRAFLQGRDGHLRRGGAFYAAWYPRPHGGADVGRQTTPLGRADAAIHACPSPHHACPLRRVVQRDGHGQIPSRPVRIQRLDELHMPLLADGTHNGCLGRTHRLCVGACGLLTREEAWPWLLLQRPALGELSLSHPVRQEAEMPDPLEPTRQNVEEEAPEELHSVERHGAEAVAP